MNITLFNQETTGSTGRPGPLEPGQGKYGMPGSAGSPLGGWLGTKERTSGTVNCLPQIGHSILNGGPGGLVIILPLP